MTNSYPIHLLDERQTALCEHFEDNPLLDTPEHVARTLDWITFYRRNEELFVEHYLGLHLFPYQQILIHELGTHGSGTIVAGRATSKTYTVGIHACAYAILNPGSLIVVASATKEQARILVYEKIQGELMRDSATLAMEIASISTGKNDTKVTFHNGSIITVVVGNENARGHRAHLLILDEFRMMKKSVVDTALTPFLINHIYPYHSHPEYAGLEIPIGTVAISSSWYASHWMADRMKDAFASYMDGGDEVFMCFDYAVCLRHNIKPRAALIKAYRESDPISWQIEYCNYMIKENTNAFFTFRLLDACRTLRHQFYPRTTADVLSRVKNRYAIPKKDGEIRILACDIAMVNRAGNDNSSFTCIRLLPEGATEVDGQQLQQGYRRQIPYAEVMHGGETVKQAIRIKQLFYDFEADYCVLDTRNAGISVYDALAKILYDEERNIEYEAWTCFNDEVIAARVPIMGARKVVYAINASARLNSEIAESLRNAFASRRIELLVSFDDADADMRSKIPEYYETMDADIQAFYERPFFETTALINEMISLEYEVSPQTRLVTVREVGKATKDRYSSLAYGNIFADYLERDLISNMREYAHAVFIN